MNMIKIEVKEWDAAKAFFHPKQGKLSNIKSSRSNSKFHRGEPGREPDQHAFIQVGDSILALANKQCDYLGKGISRVKLAQNERGENYAVKIEKITKKEQYKSMKAKPELQIMRDLHQLKAGQAALFRVSRAACLKRYLVMKKIGDQDLFEALIKTKFSQADKFAILLSACQQVKKLHDKNIIHADLKAENFMLDKHNKTITIIDFGLSKRSSTNEKFVQSKERSGTVGFIAPEIERYGLYSPASDVYAMGVMMAYQMAFIEDQILHPRVAWIMFKMLDVEPLNRPSIDRVIQYLEAPYERLSKYEWDRIHVFIREPLDFTKHGIHPGYLQRLQDNFHMLYPYRKDLSSFNFVIDKPRFFKKPEEKTEKKELTPMIDSSINKNVKITSEFSVPSERILSAQSHLEEPIAILYSKNIRLSKLEPIPEESDNNFLCYKNESHKY